MAEASAAADEGPKIITAEEAAAVRRTRFFTGKPCRRGHLVERLVSNGCCVECSRLTGKRQYVMHREKRIANARSYQARHPEEIARRKRAAYRRDVLSHRERNLLRFYGLTLANYNGMYAAQGGCCAICHSHEKVLDVDHCHEEGHVRGLLCQKCNKAIGLLGDDPEIAAAAAAYLNKAKGGKDVAANDEGPGRAAQLGLCATQGAQIPRRRRRARSSGEESSNATIG